ncbi:MAG: hypothetical protein J2P38_09740, partial [Candidatus Dormibacteraeota bacterium]|nr:hypothetical protein [Candidatus Dormibacteraeota bacterium]
MPGSGATLYVLTGVVPLVLLASFCLALPVSLLLLRLYRRAVIRGMAKGQVAAAAPHIAVPWTVRPPSAPTPLALSYVAPGSGRVPTGGGDLYRAARDRRRRAAAVYSAAGAIFSAALALASLLGPG